MPKLTPRQALVLAQLGTVSKSEANVARDANIRTTWPTETVRKHLMALRKMGLAVEYKSHMPARSVWQSTPVGRAALAEIQP